MTMINLEERLSSPSKPRKTAPDVALFLRGLHCGGAERAMVNLAGGLIDRGLKVDMVLMRAEGPYLEQLHPDVRVVDLKTQWKPASIPQLTTYLRQVQPATLVASLHYPCEIALWAKRLAGGDTRIIVTEHNTLSIEEKHSIHRLTPLMAKLFYPWADEVIAVSQGAADDLFEVTGIARDRIHVIYNPVIMPELFRQAQEPIDHPWLQPGEPPVILGVGRLTPQKDFPTLLRAFDRVRQVKPARLMILGEGPDLAQLQHLIDELGLTESVALPGFVSNPYPYMARAATFVLSSIYEGLGNVLIEAMAVGTPVVSTDCRSGPKEILADGKYGTLTPVGDDQAIAEAVLDILDGRTQTVNPEWLNQFTLEACVQKYLDVLQVS